MATANQIDPGEFVIDRNLLPTAAGMLVPLAPILVSEVIGASAYADWLADQPVPPGAIEVNSVYWEYSTSDQFIDVVFMLRLTVTDGEPMMLMHSIGVRAGTPSSFVGVENVSDNVGNPESAIVLAQAMLKWIMRLLLVASLPLAAIDHPELNRSARRRMPAGTLNRSRIIHLRPREQYRHDGDSESDTVEWSHRWMVRGHKRAQPYPSAGETRDIWIAPYIKGPGDKPLVVTEVNYALDRTE
jgi:hypothetical protein